MRNGACCRPSEDGWDGWLPCACHTLELCTLPITYTQKKNSATDAPAAAPKGSVQESFTKARGSIIPTRVLVGLDIQTREQEEDKKRKHEEEEERGTPRGARGG